VNPLIAGRLVCHVLLCETDDGLVLVDSGLGLGDVADHTRIGPARFLLNAAFAEAETAVRQVEALGFTADDVKHIAITHFDLDHVGGIGDFPNATVHTTATEFKTANDPPTRAERRRYRSAQWAYGPKVQTYAGPGESWRGFGAHQLDGVDAGIALIPLPGHTRGHAAVAVDAGDRGWLVHAGDAVFDRGSIAGQNDSADDRRMRRAIRTFEQAVAQDRSAIAGNHRRLAELALGEDVRVLPAHDPVIFDRAVAATR
jgi:glyoxylase-like metal-dependent hydrolase (beta-lactamase superfamily II)